MNNKRQRHSYPQGFPGWLSLVPVEEIEDTIGMDAFNKLVVKFREEELHHKYIAYEKGASKDGIYSIFDKIVKTGSKIAIRVSEKI